MNFSSNLQPSSSIAHITTANEYQKQVSTFTTCLVNKESQQINNDHHSVDFKLDFSDVKQDPPKQYIQKMIDFQTQNLSQQFPRNFWGDINRFRDDTFPFLSAITNNVPIPLKQDMDNVFAALQQRRSCPENLKAATGKKREVIEPSNRIEVTAETRLKKEQSRWNRMQEISQSQNLSQSTILIHCTIFHGEDSKLNNKRAREIIFTNRHTLKDVSAFIPCIRTTIQDPSECKRTESVFFIENCIFMEDMDETDTLLDVIETLSRENTKIQAPIFVNRYRLDERTLGELEIRLGEQYLFLHEHGCFHTIIFNEMRVLHKNDEQKECMYPLVKYDMVKRVQSCNICPKSHQSHAKFVTYYDEHVDSTPFYYCSHCFTDFFEDKKTKKLALQSELRRGYGYFHE